MTHTEIVSFLWGVADLIRDSFKRGKYQDVILPLTVLRRLDCVLAKTKPAVLKRQATLHKKGLENLDPQLRTAAGFAFYNTSRYDFEKLVADAPQLAANLRNYLVGFSPNMREVLDRFDFDNTISKLEEAGLLFQVVERFKNVDLHPDRVDNPDAAVQIVAVKLDHRAWAWMIGVAPCAWSALPITCGVTPASPKADSMRRSKFVVMMTLM